MLLCAVLHLCSIKTFQQNQKILYITVTLFGKYSVEPSSFDDTYNEPKLVSSIKDLSTVHKIPSR